MLQRSYHHSFVTAEIHSSPQKPLAALESKASRLATLWHATEETMALISMMLVPPLHLASLTQTASVFMLHDLEVFATSPNSTKSHFLKDRLAFPMTKV
jgi:hypothetical protein